MEPTTTRSRCHSSSEPGLVSPRTSICHYGNPHITSAVYNHHRSPSSPSTFSKERVYRKDRQVDSSFPPSAQASVEQLCLLSLPTDSDASMPHLSSKPGRMVTPNPSFGERGDSSMEHLPDYVPHGAQHQPWDVKRSSVGLPSAYPGHGRNNSLAEAVMEELQDFEELFDSSCCSNTMEVDASSSSTSSSSSPRGHQRASVAPVSDPDLVEALSRVPRRTEAKTHPARGKHRRSCNQAMGQDFFDQVLKDI
jgi:hypothetical protein